MPLTPEERRTSTLHDYYEGFGTDDLLHAREQSLAYERECSRALARQQRKRIAIEFVLKRRGALPPATLPRKEATP